MTTPFLGQGVQADDSWVATQLANLQRQITELRAAQTLNAATVGSGGITINDGGSIQVQATDGTPVLYEGIATIPDGSGRQQEIFQLKRDDGSVALILADTGTVPGHAHQQAIASFDRSGNIVFADDTTSGVGVATPYIPAGVFVDITIPTATTTSTSWTAMQWADVYQQHPKLAAAVLVETPVGVTANVRMTIGGAQIGTVLAIPANTFTIEYMGPFAWPAGDYAWQQRVFVQLEMEITSGTGTVGLRGMGLWGVQS